MSLKSFLFAPSITHPRGSPLPSVKRLRFMPCLARSVGLGPLFFPPKRRFTHRSIHRTEAPINASQLVVAFETLLPELPEYSCFPPFLKPAVGRARGTQARGVEGIPLASRLEHKEDGIHRAPVVNAPSVASQWVMGDVPWQERLDLRPQSVGYEKVLADSGSCGGFHAYSISPFGIGS